MVDMVFNWQSMSPFAVPSKIRSTSSSDCCHSAFYEDWGHWILSWGSGTQNLMWLAHGVSGGLCIAGSWFYLEAVFTASSWSDQWSACFTSTGWLSSLWLILSGVTVTSKVMLAERSCSNFKWVGIVRTYIFFLCVFSAWLTLFLFCVYTWTNDLHVMYNVV